VIDAGTQTGAVLRLRGRGVPHTHGRGRGDLLVHVGVETPTRLTPEAEALLRSLAEERGEPVDEALGLRVRTDLEIERRFATEHLRVARARSRAAQAATFAADPPGRKRMSPRASAPRVNASPAAARMSTAMSPIVARCTGYLQDRVGRRE